MSLEKEVDLLIRDGQSKGKAESIQIRLQTGSGEEEQPSGEYGYVEDIVRMSDVAEIRGYLDGLRDAVMALARAIDETGAPQ
jgi:hypothetical protein